VYVAYTTRGPEMSRDAEQIRQDIAECHGTVRRQAEEVTGHGRQVWRRKTSHKAEDALEVEAESEMERHGVRGFHKLTSIGFCMLSFSTIQQILNRQADNDPDMGDNPEF